jgi:hypothetical protein
VSALVRLLAEESGNPQILKFQIYEMGEIGKGKTDFGDVSMPAALEQGIERVCSTITQI